MKKKLFAVAIVVSLYICFMLVFTAADERGQVSRVLSEIGLSENVALAATQIGSPEFDELVKPSFRTPMPRREKPKKPTPGE